MEISLFEDIVGYSGDAPDDRDLLEAIERRVTEFMDTDPELLFSYLYRLDISEAKLKMAIQPVSGDPNKNIAQLIYDRQLERLATKKNIRQDPIEGWQW